ncbi:hypothetical protein NE235_23320 [Actinoallomurus spadix]|uniref:Uncharacterized protein n=1 Tax=Actinoallomurus spadix TaxID=79912 RepID=A0ABP3GTM4_9ACTN|nr:hypothetical protein [Actinoallomurus spadix]MCO5989042.1 hypothetical protein [Actinoallomurus spadix]
MNVEEQRAYARRLAAESIAAGDDPGRMPWPLTRAEIESFPLPAVRIEDLFDDEDPPVRRRRVEFRGPAGS